jgi:hypothetical protein
MATLAPQPTPESRLLFRSQNGVVCRVSHPEFNDRLGGDFDFCCAFGLSCNGNRYRYFTTPAGPQSSTSTKRRMLTIKREICLLWNRATI